MPTPVSNFFIKTIVQSPFHRLLGPRFAVIAFTGTITGRVYTTPVNIALSDGGYTVVSYRSRTWWRNLRGGKPARLITSGKSLAVVGHVIEAPTDVARALADYFHNYPQDVKYFQVKLGPDGKPLRADLEKAASQRVLVRLALPHADAAHASAA